MHKPKDNAFKKRMLNTNNPTRSICEVLREIYWETDDPSIRLKSLEASEMAKRMSKKLFSYNWDIHEEMGWDDLTEEEHKRISKERWDQYKEEVERGIDHPMYKPEDTE